MSYIWIDGVKSELTSGQIAQTLNVIRHIEFGPLDPGNNWFVTARAWLEERVEAYAIKERPEAERAEQDNLKKEIAATAIRLWERSDEVTLSEAIEQALKFYEVTE